MDAAAIFKINTSFNITGRGIAAYGHVIEGKVLPGYSATIEIDGQPAKVKIKSLGMGRPDENGNMQWGLILEFENTAFEKIAATNRIKEQTIGVYPDTISIEDLNTVLYKLQQLLYGYNYEVLFGVESFNNCEDLDNFKLRLKKRFPNSMAESIVPVPVSVEDFWREIEFALGYRGDSTAGVQIDEEKFGQFLMLKAYFSNFLRESIKPNSEIYSYPDVEGIPGYPVWWDFRFIILSNGFNAIFVYGSASD